MCRGLSVGPLYDRKCVDTCPQDFYSFEERRCVRQHECWNLSKPFQSGSQAGGLGDNPLAQPYIPFNGTCGLTCPTLYLPEGPSGHRECKSCNGECKKICPGSTIDSISNLQNYRGCAIITGTLILQIRQGGRKWIAHFVVELVHQNVHFYFSENVIKELEHSLSDIEEIEGALKIVRSYPLISLSFFKKLKVIRGVRVHENYAMYVMDNQNLQSLFGHRVLIESGKIFFHFNSKLCYSTIEEIKKDIVDLKGVDKYAIEDVAVNSNGDKIACK